MRGYELCLILQHETTEENIDQKVKNLQEKAVSNGGDIIKIEKWGKRSLKYAIKKQQKGYYCFVTVIAFLLFFNCVLKASFAPF